MTVHFDQCPICESKSIQPYREVKDFWVSKETFPLWKCSDCTFVFTQDMPDRASIGKYYDHDSYISHTDTNEGLLFKVYHKVRDIMLQRKAKMVANNAPNGAVLDVGAGTGYFLNTMLQLGWKALGVEPDSGAKSIAKKNFNLDLFDGLEKVNQEAGTLSAITMWHVLEHVHELDHYLKTYHSWLKKDGALIIAVPNYTSADASFYKEYWAAYDIPKHLWHFNPMSMASLATKYGFEVVKHEQLPFDPFYIAMLSEKNKGNGAIANLRAFFVGAYSYVRALLSVKRASSVVYILKKLP